MAEERITELDAITGAQLADDDFFVVVDVSDTSMAATGTDKKIRKDEAADALGGLTVQEDGVDIGTRNSLNMRSTSTVGLLIDDDGNVVSVSFRVVKYGKARTISHSYSQIDAVGGQAGAFVGFTRKIASALGIPWTECDLRGKSGAQASSPSIGDTDQQGVGAVLRHFHPPHWFVKASKSLPRHSSKADPALNIIMLGINDPARDFTVAATIGVNAYKHGIRTITAHRRGRTLRAYDDSSIAYGGSGVWSTVATNQSVKGNIKRNGTSGATFTITLPATLTLDADGNGVVDVFLFAKKNGSTSNYSITTETRVDWSGTVAAATGNTPIGGQGTGETGIQIVKRFTITEADRGKTIIGTLANVTHSDTLDVIGWGMEDPDPPAVILVNQFEHAFPSTAAFFSGSNITDFNGALDTVAAEFDDSVAVADVADPFRRLFKCTVHTLIAADAVANNAAQTVRVTPYDADANVMRVGTVLRFGPVSGTNEEMLVTAITKTSDTEWVLTVTRNYTGVDSGDAATLTSNVSHSVGAVVYDCLPVAPDRIHPSEYGHELLAGFILSTIGTLPQTDRQLAGSGGQGLPLSPPIVDGGFLYTLGGTRGTAASASNPNTQNVMQACRIYVPEDIVATSISVEHTAAATATVGRLGIYACGSDGYPGELILEAPSVDISVAAGVRTSSIWQPLKRGYYWLAYVPQGNSAVGTIRVTTDVRRSPIEPLWGATNPLASGAFADLNGVRKSSTSGALPDPFGTPTAENAGSGATAGTPALTLGYTNYIKD